MFTRKTLTAAIVGCASAGLLAAPVNQASAAMLYNQTTDTVMFQYGYEDGPAHDVNPSGNITNHTPTIGDWAPPLSATTGKAFVYETFTNTVGSVTPYTGDQFLRTYNHSGNGGVSGEMAADATSSIGDTIVFRTAYFNQRGIAALKLFHGSTDTGRDNAVWLNLWADGRISTYIETDQLDLQSTHVGGEWNELEIVYVNGEDTATLSVNGGAAETFDIWAGSGAVTGFQFQTNQSLAEAMWDAIPAAEEPPTTLIPEPASLSLLGLGGLAMLRRRRV
ncbi:MAG: PEP-CTERM sorting domain-containing protein [Phycisphaeraceae bacterium]